MLSASRGPPGRGRLVTRYQVALPGRVPGSAVTTTRRLMSSGPPPAQPRAGGPPGLGVPVAERAPDRRPVAGIFRAAPGQLAGRVHRGVRVVTVGPGPAARLERHHERQPGLRQLGPEPVLVPVRTVRAHRAERETRLTGPDRQRGADGQLGPERRVV